MYKFSVIMINTGSPFMGRAIQRILDIIPDPEIIIVEDEHARQSIDMITQFDEADIQILDVPRRTPGALLNEGIQKSIGDFIVIVSDRCIISKFDISTMKPTPEQSAVWIGKQIPIENGKRIEHDGFWEKYDDKIVGDPFAHDLHAFGFINNFTIYNRGVFGEHGMFDEDEYFNVGKHWFSAMMFSSAKKPCMHTYAPHMFVGEYNLPLVIA